MKSIDQSIGAFQALVGPNASGKSTLLDVLMLLSDIMRHRGNVAEAVMRRSSDFSKLLWKGEGQSFQIAVEAILPEGLSIGNSADGAIISEGNSLRDRDRSRPDPQ